METSKYEVRKQRGLEIAKTSRITHEGNKWTVPSQSGNGAYLVISNGFGASCTCPDYEQRRSKCKHVWAVELIITKEVDVEGNVTVTKTIRKTYAQDWHNYNLAQSKEKALFMKLLADVTSRIRPIAYTFGRPENSLGDTVFSMVFKVYSTFSSRRFNTDMELAKEQGFIGQITPRSTMSDYFNKRELTPLLAQIVKVTSLPLTTVEHDFAIDSTGFGTTNFQRWYSFKHGKEISNRRWVKAHFVTGIKSNIITSVKITSEFDNDCPELPELVKATAENFDMAEISADKAYLSVDNLQAIQDVGAKAFIPFKSNSQPSGNGMLWKKMYHYFMLNNEEFLRHYHKRSNVEATNHMIKSKFGDSVRSKDWVAQVNEVLCKIICHNISCVIMEMFTTNIQPDFVREVSEVSEKSPFSAT